MIIQRITVRQRILYIAEFTESMFDALENIDTELNVRNNCINEF